MYIYIYPFVYTRTHTHTRARTHTPHLCVCTYMYIYMYMTRERGRVSVERLNTYKCRNLHIIYFVPPPKFSLVQQRGVESLLRIIQKNYHQVCARIAITQYYTEASSSWHALSSFPASFFRPYLSRRSFGPVPLSVLCVGRTMQFFPLFVSRPSSSPFFSHSMFSLSPPSFPATYFNPFFCLQIHTPSFPWSERKILITFVQKNVYSTFCFLSSRPENTASLRHVLFLTTVPQTPPIALRFHLQLKSQRTRRKSLNFTKYSLPLANNTGKYYKMKSIDNY